LLLIRKLHVYLGFLIAPSVLFFAFSGTLQLFSLHEAHGPYHPPAFLQMLGNLHKDQVLTKPEKHRSSTPAGSLKESGKVEHARPFVSGDDGARMIKTYVLKWFFALVAVGLFVSTGFGLWIGLRYSRTPRLSWILLFAGAAIPLLIIFV
jgi:hypothetical protein